MNHLNKFLALGLLLAGSLSAYAVNMTLHVDAADAVKVEFNGQSIVLAAGDNEVDVPENYMLYATGITPWMISGVTNENGTPESVYYGSWSKYVTSAEEGQTYNIQVKNLDESRTSTCTINVDDPSLVSASLSGTYQTVALEAGENTVKFDPDIENTLTLYSNDYSKPIYSVTLDGVAVNGSSGSYIVPITDGCIVDIIATIPDVPVTVTFSYNETGEGAVAGIAVNDEDVADFDGKSVTMKAGDKLSINPNTDYSIDLFTINGAEQYWGGNYAYTINNVMTDTEIHIDAHKYTTFNVTVKISDPEQVLVYHGFQYSGELIALTAGENTIEVSENNPTISWSPAVGCYITSAIVDGEPASSDYVYCKEGTTIEIQTEAIVMDKSAMVWIDNRDAVDSYFSFQTATRDELAVTSGYNLIDFYDGYNPFDLSWYSENPVVGKIYLNNELQKPVYEGGTYYEFTFSDRDVLKMFFGEEPLECKVNFTLIDGIEAAVSHDVICEVEDLSAPLACFAGTQLNISKTNEPIEVKVNGETVDPIADSDSYQLIVSEPETSIEILPAVGVGVSGISSEETAAPVYNLQGVKVADNLRNLPAGIYIHNGKKVVVK